MMKVPSATEVRSLLLAILEERLIESGIEPDTAPDDLDLLTEGIIDSMGILEIILAVETHFELALDLENLSPEDLTILGRFCRYVAQSQTSVT